jgi:hypothetical protein
LFVIVVSLLAQAIVAGCLVAQTGILRITPSTLVVGLDESGQLNVVDDSGRPVEGAVWSLDNAIADLVPMGDSVEIQANHTGRAILTASVGAASTSSVISIVERSKITQTTVLWSVDPWPGYESLLARQTRLAAGGPDFIDVEWSKTAPLIVRGLLEDGRQIWMAHLQATGSPETIKRKSLSPVGKTVTEHGTPVNIDQMLLLEGDVVAALRNSPQSKAKELPAAGHPIFVHECGDDYGGLLYLERASSSDSLVDLGSGGSEMWRYQSAGRLRDSWTVNYNGDVGIVETLQDPPSSSLLVVNGQTGEIRFRFPIPTSSTTLNGVKCITGATLKNTRPSQDGSPFTNTDGNIYLQIAIHNEQKSASCPNESYSFENKLELLSVTPDGEATWRMFQEIHADAAGPFVVPPRVFAGESIPDGFGGVLAAWTYFFPGNREGEKSHYEARLSRLGPDDQHDYVLPMPGWNSDPTSVFDENMILGENNVLFATDSHSVLSFDVAKGSFNWIRHLPGPKVALQYATASGGFVVSNIGRLGYIAGDGGGLLLPWTVEISDLAEGVGLVQTDLFDESPAAPLALRTVDILPPGRDLVVEEGESYGRGRVMLIFAPYLIVPGSRP